MSSSYQIEPPTKGKVLLKTSVGDIDIELWPKEAPKAVRNFVQLCLEGYYDGCVFHRVLKDFLAQAGDPTGTGTTSESVYGKPFKDEFHSRLRFSHRGIVACANANVEHSNGSQFFITLGPTESLQKKNTIFGKVSGETIYNAMEFNNLEVGEDDRPMHLPTISATEVLWNPFEDIVPRTTRAEREAATARAAERAAAAARPAKRMKKNVALLSFEDKDEVEEGSEGAWEGARLKSAHEAIDDARLVKVNTEVERQITAEEAAEAEARRNAVAERLARAAAAAAHHRAAASAAAIPDGCSSEDGDAEMTFETKMRKQASKMQRSVGDAVPGTRNSKAREQAKATPSSDEDIDEEGTGGKHMEARRDAALGGKSKAATIKPSRQSRIEDAELLKPWELKRREYKQKKKMTANRDRSTLAAMQAFSKTLAGLTQSAPAPALGPTAGKQSPVEAYSGQVRTDIDQAAHMPAAWRIDALQDESSDDEPGGTLAALRRARLDFPKTTVQGQIDREKEFDSLEVVDPLLEKGKAAWNKQQAKLEKRLRAQTDTRGGK